MKKPLCLLSSLVLILFFSACANLAQQKELIVNENLPTIDELKHISNINSAAFEWKSFYNEDIEGFYLYRGGANDLTLSLVATIKDKYKTHFVDTKLEPDTKYYYAMKSFNKEGHISKEGVVVELKTMSRPVALPFVQAISSLPLKIKLIWRPHPDLRVSSYVIERAKNGGEFKHLAEVKNRLSAEYIDDNLNANESFEYRIFAKTFEGIYSESSQIISSSTKPLPPQVQNLLASTSLAFRIRLTWDDLNFKDFAYYKIYAKTNLFSFVNIAKTQSPSYEDVINEAGVSREYKVSVVDKDGLESLMSHTIKGQTLEAPKAPSIVSSTFTGSSVQLSWVDNDDRALRYEVKRYGGSDVEFKDINQKFFEDTSIVLGQEYSYEVVSIDEFGIRSLPSKKVYISK